MNERKNFSPNKSANYKKQKRVEPTVCRAWHRYSGLEKKIDL